MNLGFDIISDLQLESSDFDWEGKATSLYCVIPGNISTDMKVVKSTLLHLSTCYQGVFFIDGSLEHDSVRDRDFRIKELSGIATLAKNLVYLHDNVVVIEGIALIGANGWNGNYIPEDTTAEIDLVCAEYEDISYLGNTIDKLQELEDVKSIVIVTNSIPLNKLYYGDKPLRYSQLSLADTLVRDNNQKVSHWIFSSTEKIIDIMDTDINYLNNPKYTRKPYYAKRIEVSY